MRGGTLEVSSQTLERFIFVDLKGRMTESEIKRENEWLVYCPKPSVFQSWSPEISLHLPHGCQGSKFFIYMLLLFPVHFLGVMWKVEQLGLTQNRCTVWDNDVAGSDLVHCATTPSPTYFSSVSYQPVPWAVLSEHELWVRQRLCLALWPSSITMLYDVCVHAIVN